MSKELDLIKKDLNFAKFFKENKLLDTYLDSHINQIIRVYKSCQLCQNCTSLENCRQNTKGQRLALEFNDTLLDSLEICPYALKEKKKTDLKSEYVYCDIPVNLMNIDLNNIKYFDNQKDLYFKLANILYKRSDKGLYINGYLGVGKTYLCIGLANSLVKNKQKVAFVKVSNFFNEMKTYVSSNHELLEKYIIRLQKCDYLFLDDIGSEAVSEFVRDDILFRILDYRLENKLMTIFTSNLDKDSLLEHYTYDRNKNMNEMNAKRLMERIDILTSYYVLVGSDLRKDNL